MTGLYLSAPPGSEDGQGHFVIQQGQDGEALFDASYIYGLGTNPLWLVAALTRTGPGSWTGSVYTGTGPSFDAFGPTNSTVVPIPAGDLLIQQQAMDLYMEYRLKADLFSGPGLAKLGRKAGSEVVITKVVTPQVFAYPLPACRPATPAEQVAAINFQDLWWAYPPGSESGWGLTIAHQGDVVFVAWFTYGADGKALWMVFAATKTAPNTYSGNVFTAKGPPFNVVPFDPSDVVGTQVGTATLTFADGNRGTFAYTVNGISQSKQITRQQFAAAGNVCL